MDVEISVSFGQTIFLLFVVIDACACTAFFPILRKVGRAHHSLDLHLLDLFSGIFFSAVFLAPTVFCF